MEDEKVIETLTDLREREGLTENERSALAAAIGFLSLANRTQKSWVRSMKRKREANLHDLD